MRTSVARSLSATLLVLGAAIARAAHAQAPAARAPFSANPAETRAQATAFRDTVDGALALDAEDSPRRSALARRITGGLSLAVSQPLGDFRRGGRVGFGVAGFASMSVDPAGVLGLRLEGGGQNYGTASLRTTVPSFGYYATQLRQTTRNDIYWLGIGPQVTIPLGPVRPYGFATIGGANFTTATTLRYALYGADQEYQATDLSSWALARAAGGGVRFRVGATERNAAYVDAGARWQRVNDVRYLTPGTLPGDIDPNTLALRGRADFVTYHLGVSITGR